MVATGTLPNGSPVILKADGTVEVVAGTTTTYTESIPAGSEVVFNAGSTLNLSVAFDPNNANSFVIAYKDIGNLEYLTACVGTVSGTSISFGAEYVLLSANSNNTVVAFDPNTAGKFVVIYSDYSNGGYGTGIVGTVVGTTLSFGSSAVFNAGASNYFSMDFDPNTAGKFVVIYTDDANSSYGTAVVGTVSGTSVSFGAEYVILSSGNTLFHSIVFDPSTAGKFVVAYRDDVGGDYGEAKVGTVSGTTISFGTEAIFQSSRANLISASFDPNNANSFVVVYQDYANSNYGAAVVGTVSGTTITFGTKTTFNSGAATWWTAVSFDPNTANRVVVSYTDGNYTAAPSKVIIGTVSGTGISFGSEYEFNASTHYNPYIDFDPSTPGKFVAVYTDSGNSSYGTAIVGQLAATVSATNLTSTNLLGISQKAVANGETTSVETLGGLSAVHSGLTIGSDYYVATDGSLTTTSTDNVSIGKAVAATTLNMRDYV